MYVMEHYHEADEHAWILTQDIVYENIFMSFLITSRQYRRVTHTSFGIKVCTNLKSMRYSGNNRRSTVFVVSPGPPICVASLKYNQCFVTGNNVWKLSLIEFGVLVPVLEHVSLSDFHQAVIFLYLQYIYSTYICNTDKPKALAISHIMYIPSLSIFFWFLRNSPCLLHSH